jgi:hypothetical protein
MGKPLVFILLLLLAACTEAPPAPVKIVRAPGGAADLRVAAEIPTTGDERTLFDWGAAERSAGEDCRDKLGWLRDLQVTEP